MAVLDIFNQVNVKVKQKVLDRFYFMTWLSFLPSDSAPDPRLDKTGSWNNETYTIYTHMATLFLRKKPQ